MIFVVQNVYENLCIVICNLLTFSLHFLFPFHELHFKKTFFLLLMDRLFPERLIMSSVIVNIVTYFLVHMYIIF